MNFKNSKALIWTVGLLAAAGSLMAQQTNAVSPKDFETFKIITDRNIFDVNRRPAVARASRPPPAIVDTFALTGTMSYENGPFAVFDGSSSEYHKVLGPGGTIAGYTVAEISHDIVKLVSGTNEMELKVGTQMRRSEDGKWSVGPRESFLSFNSDSRSGGSESYDRGGRRSSFFPSRNSFRGVPGQGAGNPPVSSSTLDPNDVIARLMANRNREVGGNTNQNEAEPGNENPDVLVVNPDRELSNGPGENPDQNTNRPNETPDATRNVPPENPGRNP
jgi:hypothetical protein